MGYLQPWHIIVLLAIALLLFGGKRLPEVGRSLGHGMREFKDAVTGNTSAPSETQPELPPAEVTTATPTTATPPPERETV
ncbi:MAG TPA: twin-arginine translocase TatA/TatE family subunit [Gaiellaceae bacterium]|jgi:sec-independent protein translocase protein TatA